MHEMTADELYQILDDTGIDYTVSESMDGARVLTFRVDDGFNPRTRDDWTIYKCGEQWAIFSKRTGKEWKDPQGDYLGFNSASEANQYLAGFFDALETK